MIGSDILDIGTSKWSDNVHDTVFNGFGAGAPEQFMLPAVDNVSEFEFEFEFESITDYMRPKQTITVT